MCPISPWKCDISGIFFMCLHSIFNAAPIRSYCLTVPIDLIGPAGQSIDSVHGASLISSVCTVKQYNQMGAATRTSKYVCEVHTYPLTKIITNSHPEFTDHSELKTTSQRPIIF
jgi:hypothetical protein